MSMIELDVASIIVAFSSSITYGIIQWFKKTERFCLEFFHLSCVATKRLLRPSRSLAMC